MMTKFNGLLNFIKKYWKSFYLAFLGIFWISYFIYIRIVLERDTYTLNQWEKTATLTIVFLQIFFLVVHLIFFARSLYDIYRDYKIIYIKDSNFPKGLPKNMFLEKIQIFLNQIFIEPLDYTRKIIASKIPGLHYYILHQFLRVAFRYNLYKKGYWLVFLFYIFPRGFVATIFFVEIIFYNQIYYFVRSLIILIIPIIWVIFVELLADRGLIGIEKVHQFFTITPIGEMNSMGIHEDGYMLCGREGYEYDEESVLSYKALMEESLAYRKLSIGCFSFYKMIANPYITAYCSSLYVMGFGYKLAFLLF